jgi:hypothetical protein
MYSSINYNSCLVICGWYCLTLDTWWHFTASSFRHWKFMNSVRMRESQRRLNSFNEHTKWSNTEIEFVTNALVYACPCTFHSPNYGPAVTPWMKLKQDINFLTLQTSWSPSVEFRSILHLLAISLSLRLAVHQNKSYSKNNEGVN